jgi:IS1 family transposase
VFFLACVFDHLAMTALRADSLRSSGVIAAALAGPPFFPPFLPSATACGFFAMPKTIPDRSRKNKKIMLDKYVSGHVYFGSMNVLAQDEKVAVIAALVEGNSIRSIERMTGIHRDTIMRLSVRVGEHCARLLDERIRNVRAQRVQVDEIWTFVFVKQARLNGYHDHAAMGDQYVFFGMDSDSKLVISHLVGKRDAGTATEFMQDLSERLATRVQLTTDGFKPYIPAVEDSFGADVDYAQLVKLYGQPKANGESRDWYSPVRVMAAIPMRVAGKPNPAWISTSYIERQNLTIRMQVRRFARLTNGFSKKLENLRAAIALHFAHYNFVRIHQTLRITPAMAAGITDHVWELEALLR